MKLLLTTIKSDCKSTDLELKSLYSVVCDSPLDVQLKTFGRNDLYTDIFESITTAQYDIVYFQANSCNIRQLLRVAAWRFRSRRARSSNRTTVSTM